MTESSPKFIGEKYQVLRELGRGASGLILLAKDEHQKLVAIKCLLQEKMTDRMLKHLQNEFIVLRSLTHPNIAQPLDFGFDHESEQYFIVTEYIDGSTLDKAVEGIDADKTLSYLTQALQALQYMHRQNVFHCDIKPANILVTPNGILKIIDFDVATTGNRVIGGTLSYAAPEVISGLQALANSKIDLYSLGATFYHVLTGERPYPARDIEQLRLMYRAHKPSDLSHYREDLKHLNDSIGGLLQINPSHRYATAAAVMQSMRGYHKNSPVDFEIDDIRYRLMQHGRPIGKQSVLNLFQSFIDNEFATHDKTIQRIYFVKAKAGLGSSYLLRELKAIAQMSGIDSYEWSSLKSEVPHIGRPAVWLIDDWSKLNAAKQLELLGHLHEFRYHARHHDWMVVMAGVRDPDHLPHDLQIQFHNVQFGFELREWDDTEFRDWLRDVFQSEDVPDFLIQKLFYVGKGAPAQFVTMLLRSIEQHLLFDDNGRWRKDLFNPHALFESEFTKAVAESELSKPSGSISNETRDVLIRLSLSYAALPVEYFIELDSSNAYRIAELRAQQCLHVSEDGLCSIRDIQLQREMVRSLFEDEKVRLHDLFLLQLDEHATLDFDWTQERHYHMAYGSSIEQSIRGWNHFAMQYARGGLWQSAYEAYSEIIKRLSLDDEERRFQYLVERSKFISYLKSPDEAAQILNDLMEQSAHLAEVCRSNFSRLQERLGLIEMKRGRFDRARVYFETAQHALGPEQQPLEQFLGIQNFIAGIELSLGRYAEAIQIYSMTRARALNDLPTDKQRILTNNDLPQALFLSGESELAVKTWHEFLEEYRSREDLSPYARTCYQLAQAMIKMNDVAIGQQYLQLSLEACQKIRDSDLELRVHNAIANLHLDFRLELALEHYERALHLAFQSHNDFTIAVLLINIGSVLLKMQNLSRAKHSLTQALEYLQSLPESLLRHGKLIHSVHLEIARIYYLRQQYDFGLNSIDEALSLITLYPTLDLSLFDTQLLHWQLLVLAGQREKAVNVHHEVKTLILNDDERSELAKVELLLQRQWSSLKGETPEVSPLSAQGASVQEMHATIDFSKI